MRSIPQRQHIESLLASNRAVITRIRDTVSAVPSDTLSRRPSDGGWSIAEVLEHLIISADSYLHALRPILQQGGNARADSSSEWKPSFMGGLLAQSLRNPRKMPTAKSLKPGPQPRPRVLEEFVQRQEEVGRLLTDANALDWRRVPMRSPILPIVRMNLGDALTVLVVHAERHAAQIERVKAKTLGEEKR